MAKVSIKFLTLFAYIYCQNMTGSISGNVFGNNEPLIGANVIINGTSMGATTDFNGYYQINNIPLGKYIIRAEYIGYESEKIELYISEMDNDPLNNSNSSFSNKIGIEEEQETAKILKANKITGLEFFLKPTTLDLNEIVVSASKIQQKITEAPSIVAVINNQSIRRRIGVNDYNRLANMAKGVDVSYYGSQGAQINARGFDGAFNTRFRTFSDGLYNGDAVSGTIFSVLSGPPKEAISRIEVLFGPQAALYGPDASQGLLNVISKHPMIDKASEISLSSSNFIDPRIGARFVKNYKKVSFDISSEIKTTKEIPYNNEDGEIYWVIGDTLYLNDDVFSSMEINKYHFRSNLYYRLNGKDELSLFYHYTNGSGYSMGSFGPNYMRDLAVRQYGLRFTNRNHFFRMTRSHQTGKMAPIGSIIQTRMLFRDPIDNSNISWSRALDKLEESGVNWWLRKNSDDFLLDYQFNKKTTDNLILVFGIDYEYKDPNTNRTLINDIGISPITGEFGGYDINEYRYGAYGQAEYLINDNYSINSSIRYDDHEFYGKTISPRISFVRKRFLNGSLKLIAGTGFKAPTLMERNIYGGQNGIASGIAGNVDPFLGVEYPQDWNMNALILGSPDGFTVVDFKDFDGNNIYSEGDSLIKNEYIQPLELEETQSVEIAYTGVINRKNLIEFNIYSGRYKNFKGPGTGVAVTGPGWNYMAQSIPGPLPFDALRQVHYGADEFSNNPIPQFTYFLTYPNLPLDVIFYGFEGGWKHLGQNFELGLNFSFFSDENLVNKRKKAKKYFNYLSGVESAVPSDSLLEKYYSYLQIYSNTPNFKGSISLTNSNGIINNLTSVFTLKTTSKYDFVSGFFEATEEGKGQLPASANNQSFFRNPGQLGGQLYADVDLIYDFNKEIYFGFSVKNLLNSDAISLPLSPKTPRQFVVETGYKFN